MLVDWPLIFLSPLSRTQLQPTLLPTPGVPWPPQLPVLGEQTPEPSDVHGPAAAVAHNSHREELVRVLSRGGVPPPLPLTHPEDVLRVLSTLFSFLEH